VVKYIVQRLVALLAILFVVSLGSFFLTRLLPGDIYVIILGTGDTPANRLKAMHQYGFDKGLIIQYWRWLLNVLHGQLGFSYFTTTPVLTEISKALPLDGELILLSQILAFGAAIPLALRCARRPGGLLDRFTTSATFVLLSIPAFVVIVELVAIVAIQWGIPNTGENVYNPFGSFWVNLSSMALPSITLALGSFVVYFRVFRSDLIATYQEEFITMARSKGLSRRRIVWRHAFRPSSIALLSTAGVNIGGLVAGTFIVEYLTGIPGMGKLIIVAIGTQDYVTIQGCVLVIATIVILLNFAIDLSFGFIDPRITRD
jgi:peptide/nickel transport system permease protein